MSDIFEVLRLGERLGALEGQYRSLIVSLRLFFGLSFLIVAGLTGFLYTEMKHNREDMRQLMLQNNAEETIDSLGIKTKGAGQK